jgi:hypothetical protein
MIDCHVHVFDPAHFPYAADTFYAPAPTNTRLTNPRVEHLDATHTPARIRPRREAAAPSGPGRRPTVCLRSGRDHSP